MAKAATKKKPKAKVRSVRFAPDPGTIAEVQFKLDDGLTLSVYGLVVNESRSGCAAVIMTDQKILEETLCTIRVGELPRTVAGVVWVKKLEPGLLKVGFEYDL